MTPKESFIPNSLRSPSDPEGRKQVNVKLLAYKCPRKNLRFTNHPDPVAAVSDKHHF